MLLFDVGRCGAALGAEGGGDDSLVSLQMLGPSLHQSLSLPLPLSLLLQRQRRGKGRRRRRERGRGSAT